MHQNHESHRTALGVAAAPPRIAYVLKRYPRFSETFVVNEILAHEAAGLNIEIFALRPTSDTHFQHAIADVRAPVRHLRYGGVKAETLWQELASFSSDEPARWQTLARVGQYSAVEIFQGVQLARSVLQRRITHIHAHFATTAAAVARVASLMTGVPYSFTAHAKDIFHEQVDAAVLADKIADASHVVTVSDYNLNYLSQQFPHAAQRIRRVYNGLKVDEYQFSDPGDRRPFILAVGRLVEKKGFACLIDACRLLVRQGMDFQCQIIGGGDLGPVLRSQVEEQGLRDFVELTGPRPRDEVLRRMGEAAVFAAPCVTAVSGDRDGLPTVLLEAMACGAPCVSTELVGIPEAVCHGRTGLLTPERDVESLADALRQFLVNGLLRSRMAQAARAVIEAEFDVARNTAALRRLFATNNVANASPAGVA